MSCQLIFFSKKISCEIKLGFTLLRSWFNKKNKKKKMEKHESKLERIHNG